MFTHDFANKFIQILNISHPFYQKQCEMHLLPSNERLGKKRGCPIRDTPPFINKNDFLLLYF